MSILRIFFIACLLYPLFGDQIDSTQLKKPEMAFRASVIPGGGQIYNGKFFKALSLALLEGMAYNSWLENAAIYKDYDTDDYPLRKHRYLEKRNKYAWWVGFIYVYGMIDAVVDAHLSPFNDVMASPIELEPKSGEDNE